MTRSLLFFVFMPIVGASAQSPCTSATPSCTEHLALGGGSGYTVIYRSYPLDRKNEKITRAFVMVHGASRDANNYFRHAVAAAFLADALDNTIVVAPRPGYTRDKRDRLEQLRR